MSRNTLTGDSADHIRQSIEMTAQGFASLRRQRVPAHRFALDVHMFKCDTHVLKKKSVCTIDVGTFAIDDMVYSAAL